MGHDWKPGDVAMIQAHVGRQETLAMYGHDNRWHGTDGIYRLATDVRPLVVIDPEDREQVEWLLSLLDQRDWHVEEDSWQDMQAALREFAAPTPPRPDEPMTRGAVVEDKAGLAWVRVHPGGEAWVNGYGRWAAWSDIDAIEVKRP